MRHVPLLAVSLFLAGQALAEPLRVLTDIPVTGGLVAAVAGDGAEVTVLLEGLADPHSFQMRPSQARALGEADLVIWMGPELTPWLDRALEANAGSVPRLALLDAEGVFLREIGVGADGDAGHADHVHDHDHDHAHDGIDPHAWLDPANAALWAGSIAAALSGADAAGVEAFSARATALAEDIRALDAELAQALAPARATRLIFQHDAYGYLTAHFGLADTAAISDVDGVDPGAGRLADLTEAQGSACVFGEAGKSAVLAERLAGDLGAGFAVLDPTGAMVPQGPGHYRALMTGLATAIRDCVTPRG